MDQIITAAERAATNQDTGLTGAQVDQLTNLLRAAAELERAQRPIYLASPEPVVVQPTGHGAPPDFGGRYPSPAEFAGVVEMPPLRPGVLVRHWGRPTGLAGVVSLVGGAGAGVVTGTAAAPVVAILAGLLAVAAGVARGTSEQRRENGS